jgi:hypothetical protein
LAVTSLEIAKSLQDDSPASVRALGRGVAD